MTSVSLMLRDGAEVTKAFAIVASVCLQWWTLLSGERTPRRLLNRKHKFTPLGLIRVN